MYAYALGDLFDHHTYPYSPSHMYIYLAFHTSSGALTPQPSPAVASLRHQSTGGALHYLPIVQLPEAQRTYGEVRTHIKAIAITHVPGETVSRSSSRLAYRERRPSRAPII